LGLRGLIHLCGTAGSGKTLLAVAIASDVSRYARVEWINTDGKRSFVNHLKTNVRAIGGNPDNVTITMTDNQKELLTVIETLPALELPGLIVIDPLTRVLDLARKDPTLWGREIVEDVLPTLAGLLHENDLAIIITSESRMMKDSETSPVHYNTISKWIDCDLCLNRDLSDSLTHIIKRTGDIENETARLRLDTTGVLEIIPTLIHQRISEGVG
jgi:hypothetical protein